IDTHTLSLHDALPISFNIGAGNFEIDFAIRGPDLKTLAMYAEQLRSQAPQLGLLDAINTLELNKPELRVEIDRARAADLGVETRSEEHTSELQSLRHL